MKYRIYALKDPRTNAVRYVGVTVGTIEDRSRQHISDARGTWSKTRNSAWIRSLFKSSLLPAVSLLEETDDKLREVFWIAEYRKAGVDLTNHTDGGEGTVGYRHTEEAKEAVRRAKSGVKCSPESSRLKSEARLGYIWPEDVKKRIGDSNRGKPKTGRQALGHKKSDATRRKMAKTWTKKWADPEYAKKNKGTVAEIGRRFGFGRPGGVKRRASA